MRNGVGFSEIINKYRLVYHNFLMRRQILVLNTTVGLLYYMFCENSGWEDYLQLKIGYSLIRAEPASNFGSVLFF